MALSRRKSRELALQVLYQVEFSKQPSKTALPLFFTYLVTKKSPDDFAALLVQGVEEHQTEIDKIIRDYSEHWSLERISPVDRNIIRIAIFEILWCPDVPPKVSINEAIELGKKFGTEKSASFINGILDRVAHMKDSKE